MNITWPSRAQQDEFLNATLGAIGRDVDFFYIYSSMACPDCVLDPVTNTSTDSFCPLCSGNYWIPIMSGVSISGHVTWKYSENVGWYTAGRQFEGIGTVRINYTPENYAVVQSAEYLVVDDRTMQIDKIDLRGAPEINRIILTLQEKEKD